jgi:hypothetical protein
MERSDVSHQLLAMDFLPEDMQQVMLEKVACGVGRGRIAALPGVVHSMEAVQSALRQMSQVSNSVYYFMLLQATHAWKLLCCGFVNIDYSSGLIALCGACICCRPAMWVK